MERTDTVKYKARMKHSEETIYKLAETQYNTFQFGKKIVRVVFALLLIAVGIYVRGEYLMPWVCLILGCILISGLNMRPRHSAKLACQQMNGNYPSSEYSFEEAGFRFFREGELTPYSKLIRLVEDRLYFYLYVSTQSAYMVDRSTVQVGTAEDLKKFLTVKSGLKWTHPNSFLLFRFTALSDRLREANAFKGDRLR